VSQRLPAQVWLLTLCYALMLSGTSMLVLIAGIIGQQIAPSEALATLPIALAIIGLALNTLPAAFLMSRWGRKPIFLTYGIFGVITALIAAYAMHIESFTLFCFAALGIGSSAASVQQYRFAAIEQVTVEQIPKATSTILLGGIVAAFIGPELSLLGQSLLTMPYAGSFLLLSGIYLLGLLMLTLIKVPPLEQTDHQSPGRGLSTLFRQRTLLIAIAAAAVGYGIMSFIMTATPLSMHTHFHHSLQETKWVIQSHVAAMYLPSLISGVLIQRFGHSKMMFAGLFAYILCLLIAYQWQTFIGFWVALVLLGIGWNFLFVAGTALLATTYQSNERFKVQATNDFLVFGTQAIAALSSGWLLFQFKWQGILLLCFIPLALFVFTLILALFKERRIYANHSS